MYCADFHTEKSGVKSLANFDALGFNDLKKPRVILICGISDSFWYGLFAGLDPSMGYVNFLGFFSLAKMPTIPNGRDRRVETRRWQDTYSFLVVKFKLESTLSLKFPFKTGPSSLLYSCLNENREFSQQKVRAARERAPRLQRGTRADSRVTGATQKCFISYDLLLTNDAAL